MGSKNTTISSGRSLPQTVNQVFRKFGTHQFIILALLAVVAMGTESCKAKKEARARQEALDARISEAKATLLAIINDKTMPLEDKESELERIKDMSLQDSEIQDLIERAEEAIAEQRAAQEEENAAAKQPAKTNTDASAQLDDIFRSVASGGGNDRIREAISMFSSPDALVLIIISEEDGQKDYDEPTTIQKYLDYLKDTKSKPAAVYNVEYGNGGKIKELELIKR